MYLKMATEQSMLTFPLSIRIQLELSIPNTLSHKEEFSDVSSTPNYRWHQEGSAKSASFQYAIYKATLRFWRKKITTIDETLDRVQLQSRTPVDKFQHLVKIYPKFAQNFPDILSKLQKIIQFSSSFFPNFDKKFILKSSQNFVNILCI